MLTEGFLATLVILACVAGLGLGIRAADGTVLTGTAAWEARYTSWGASGALANTVGAFVDGAANFLAAAGIPATVGVALMGVLVASFAGTTLDTACRLQRYVVQELASRASRSGADALGPAAMGPGALWDAPLALLRNKHGATLFAVAIAALLAAPARPGTPWSLTTAGAGGLILWPMFGATNQLLGGLAFLVIAFYLRRRRKPVWFLLLPLIFMLIMPAWAMLLQLPEWFAADVKNWPLMLIAATTLALEAWMIVEAALLWPRVRGQLEAQLDGLNSPSPAGMPVSVEA
jgi:carbon starvation protein